MASRASFGQITLLPSKRYRARYAVPDVYPRTYVNAPVTYTRKKDAQDWLAAERTKIVTGVSAPAVRDLKLTLREYIEKWMVERRNSRGEPLRASVVRSYREYHKLILPALGDVPLSKISRSMIEGWYAQLSPNAPTMRANTYAHLRTVLGSAEFADIIPANPCRIRGASATRAVTKPVVATPAQVLELVEALPGPLKLAPLLGAWCQLRNGELLELCRSDVGSTAISITRAVTFTEGQSIVGSPKTDAGVRTLSIPPHIRDAVRDHLETYVGESPDSLLFPAREGVNRHMVQQTFAYHFKRAVLQTSLPPTFRFHWLRHTGLTMAAQAGATIAELMNRAGHSTASTVIRYQHATSERDERLARQLSALAEG